MKIVGAGRICGDVLTAFEGIFLFFKKRDIGDKGWEEDHGDINLQHGLWGYTGKQIVPVALSDHKVPVQIAGWGRPGVEDALE